MGGMKSTNVQDNEILKAVDVNNGFDAQITNITKAFQCLLENKQDFVISSNEMIKYHSTQEADWNLRLDPIYGICHSTGISFLDTETTLIPVQQPLDGHNRIDIIEICGELKTSNPQKRSFIDFDTKATVVDSVDTQKILALRCRAKSTDIKGSITPPNHTDGWVKIGELFIPGDATKISDCTIYNITSDVSGANNENWTAEKNITFNVGYISDISQRFREEHNADGTHKNTVIKASNIDIGTGTNQLSAKNIPTGNEIKVNDETFSATENATQILVKLAIFANSIHTKLTSLTGDDVTVNYESVNDTLTETLKKIGKVKKINDQLPDENGNVLINGNHLNVSYKGEDDTLNNTLSKIDAIVSLTRAEYEALSEEAKMNGTIYNITDEETEVTNPVDIVEEGNMNPVTSNAVSEAITNIKVETTDIVEEDNENPVTSGGVYTAIKETAIEFPVGMVLELEESLDPNTIYKGTWIEI